MPSPFREEEKSDKDKNKRDEDGTDSDEWTETSGGGVRGFVPTFLQRTKTKDEAETLTKKTKKRSPRDLIANVETLQDYKAIVADETEKITVVRFFAKWCRSCRASEPQFHKLVHDFADHGVKFVQVPLKRENAFLHEGLGVPSVPFAHIYHPDGGLVEEMKMNKKKFAKFRTSLEQYVSGSCYLEDEPEDDDVAEDIDDGTPIGEFQ
jgi:thiol-disulfide isomerase/thioredoxin